MRCSMCGCHTGADFTQLGATRLCGSCNGYSKDQINPDHYTAGGIETIDYLEAKLTPEEFKGFLKGNIIKYSSRAGKKDLNPESQDFEKVQWYNNKLLETLKKETP